MANKFNLHLYPSALRNESRILKITKSLTDARIFDEIDIVGLWENKLPEKELLDSTRVIIRIKTGHTIFHRGIISKIFSFLKWYSKILSRYWNQPITCINAHSLSVLPIAAVLKFRHKGILIYDAHELETETSQAKGIRKILAKLTEQCFIGMVDEVIVVSKSIADWYKKRYSFERVWVIRNIPYRNTKIFPSNILKHNLGIDQSDIIFLYQGALGKGRGIEILLDIFSSMLHTKHLVFMGYGTLEEEIKRYSKKYTNIHFHDAVSPSELVWYTMGADVGFAVTQNTCLSHYFSLPNKVFEYIMSGIPVIVSDFPELANIVGNSFGWSVSPEKHTISDLISRLDASHINEMRNKVLKENTRFGWDVEERTLFEIYRLYGFDAIQDVEE